MTTSGQAGALIAGRYRLERPTGGGTWPEEIWQGFDETLNRPVMLRLLPLDGEVEPDLDEQVQSVVAQVARLGHPNIAQVYDVGHESGLRYVVSEWTGGRTLGQIMSTGRQRWQRAVDWGQQIAEALGALHAVGLVDGVLGPETVSVLDDRRVKLTDVGLGAPQDGGAATRLQPRPGAQEPTQLFDPDADAGQDGDADATRLLPPGSDPDATRVVPPHGPDGEPTRMVPAYGPDGEPTRMVSGGPRGAVPAAAPADVYALGAILWTAMVGAPPHVGPGDTQGPDVGPLHDTGAPADLARLLQQMLAASATVRPSAAIAANRFAALAIEGRERNETLPTAVVGQSTQGLGEQTRMAPPARGREPEPEPAGSRRGLGIAIGLILLLAVAGTAIGLVLANHDSGNPGPSATSTATVPTESAGVLSFSPNSTAASAPATSNAPTSSSPTQTSASPTATATTPTPTQTSASPSAPPSTSSSPIQSGGTGSPTSTATGTATSEANGGT